MTILRDIHGHILVCHTAIEFEADLIRLAIREGVDLRGANLAGLDLSGMDLSNLDFSFANFQGAILIGTNFKRSLLKRANFCSANMKGTDLSHCDVRGAMFTEALFDAETSFKDVIYLGSEFESATLPKVANSVAR